MKLIAPDNFSTKITQLVEQAVEKIIFISTSYHESVLHELKNALLAADQRQVKIFFYIDTCDSEGLLVCQQLPGKVIQIEHLNLNLFLNESEGMFASKALVNLPETINLSYFTENETEYQQLFTYYVELIHSQAYNSTSYFLLDKNVYEEPILRNYILQDLNHPESGLHKTYHPFRTFLQNYGYESQNKRVGRWLNWNINGFLQQELLYDHSGLIEQSDIVYDKNIAINHLLFSFVNIISGIYKISVAQADLSTDLKALLGNRDREPFFQHIQNHLRIEFPPCAIHSLNDVCALVKDQITRSRIMKLPLVNWWSN
ncbi:MAG: hypothetical protein ACNS62_15830 [Candidatus Cyclobacteriaceae bacterium M3_2C_046]